MFTVSEKYPFRTYTLKKMAIATGEISFSKTEKKTGSIGLQFDRILFGWVSFITKKL